MSLNFPEDTVERWRAQYNAAGAFNVSNVAELETHDQTELHTPLAIPRERGAPMKKRKCSRRDAVKLYAKQMRREGGLAAVAVAPVEASAGVARGIARGTSRSVAPAGAPVAHARSGKRTWNDPRTGTAAPGPGVTRTTAPPRTRR